MVEQVTHEQLVEYAVRLTDGRRGGPFKKFGHYIPDVFTSKTLIECKTWSPTEYAQFEQMLKVKGKKKILVIHLPETFEEVWILSHHKYSKRELPFKTVFKQKRTKDESKCLLCNKPFNANYKFCESLKDYVCDDCCLECYGKRLRKCIRPMPNPFLEESDS